MNKRVRTIYPPEFKQRAVERAKAGDRSVRQIENEMGLSANLLRQWVQQYDKYGERAWIRPAPSGPVSAGPVSAGTVTAPSPAAATGAGKTNGRERELRAQLDAMLRLNQRLQQDTRS